MKDIPDGDFSFVSFLRGEGEQFFLSPRNILIRSRDGDIYKNATELAKKRKHFALFTRLLATSPELVDWGQLFVRGKLAYIGDPVRQSYIGGVDARSVARSGMASFIQNEFGLYIASDLGKITSIPRSTNKLQLVSSSPTLSAVSSAIV